MEDWQRRVIKINLPELIRNTHCNTTLLAILSSKELISDEEKIKIDVTLSPIEKADFLYKIIVTRKNAYDGLLKASREVKQSGVVNILENGELDHHMFIECNINDFSYKIRDDVSPSSFDSVSRAIAEYVEIDKFKAAFESCTSQSENKPWLLPGPDDETYLHIAAAHGYVKLIDYLIELGLPVSTLDNNGQTAGHYVGKFSANIVATLKTLVKNGLNIRQGDSSGLTIASKVVRYGKINKYHYHHLVDFMVKTGYGDVFRQKSKAGSTPFMHALEMLDLEKRTMELILNSSNVNINQSDEQGRTALHSALISGRSLENIKAIIELGGDYKIKDDQKEGALHLAVRGSNKDVINFMTSLKLDINEVDEISETPLHKLRFTKTRDFLGITSCLLDLKADLQAKNKHGDNIAHLFAITRNISLDDFQHWVKGMTDNGHGHIFAARGFNGQTPLQSAMQRLDLDLNTIKLMLESSKVNIDQPADNGSTLLHLALDFGRSIQTVKNLIQLGANIKLKNNNESGALHFAVIGGNKEAIQYLVSLDLDVNEKDKYGHTPLHKVPHTRLKNYFKMTKLLLDNGADLCAKDKLGDIVAHLCALKGGISSEDFQLWAKGMTDNGHGQIFTVRGFKGRTPLQSAMQRLDLDLNTIKLILESSKVDIDQLDDDGYTLLHLALLFGRSTQTAKNMIKLGANIKVKTNSGSGALHLAVIGGNKETIQHLVSLDLNVNEKTENGSTPLHFVPHTRLKNYFEMTKLLLDNGADLCAKDTDGDCVAHLLADAISQDDFQVWVKGMINDGHKHIFAVRGLYGRTPLQSAMETLDLDLNTIKLILESSKVNINQQDDDGCTLLHLALIFGRSTQTIKNLIQLGANIKLKNNCGSGALHLAVEGGNIEAIQYLVSLDLDVNEKNKDGKTPLHYVRITRLKNYFEITKLLLDNGADLCAKVKDGYNIAHLLALAEDISSEDFQGWVKGMTDNGHGNIFAERNLKGKTPLHSAIWRLDLDFNTIKLILESSKVNIDQPDDNGYTLLHLALDFGRSTQTIKNLIQLGANIKLKNNCGSGALHLAVEGGNIEAIQYLVSLDLNVNDKDEDGKTPLHYVPLTRLKNYFEITKLLLDNGADLCAKDRGGGNIAHFCALTDDISLEDFQLWVKGMTDDGYGHIFSVRGQWGRTPLQSAIESLDLNLNTITLILESAKVHIDQPDDDGNTLFHLALMFGRSIQTIKNLTRLSANTKLKNYDESGALHLAVIGGNKEAIQYLVSQDFDINEKNKDGETPLHKISWTGGKDYLGMTKLLLENGANLSATDIDGETLDDFMSTNVSTEEYCLWKEGMIKLGHTKIFQQD